MPFKVALSVVIGTAAFVAGSTFVEAQDRRSARDERVGNVQTCSRYGHGCASAPIRRGAFDYEFQMPGGTWVGCRQDCREALREEVLDFWETQRERAGDRLN